MIHCSGESMIGYDRRSAKPAGQKDEKSSSLPGWVIPLILSIFAIRVIIECA